VAPHDSTLRDFDAETDRRLVSAVADGSTEALGRLYDRYASTVYGLAKRVVQGAEDAEEVAQDVFAQVWRDAARYQAGRATVAGWIVMLTRARAIDRLRARRARPDVGQGTDSGSVRVASAHPDPEQVSISSEAVGSVRQALTGLPEPQRELIQLAYYEGLTHTEIAERTGIPLGTVKTRLRTAMATLRGAMAP
jgi:RNA polymerase sigma-70 factor (ECF subfamily)